jgi:hypothetical protein
VRQYQRVPKPPPESTKVNLQQRVTAHVEARWPALTAIRIRHRGLFAHLDGHLPNGTVMPLCRLRYNGSAHLWGFAIYLASRDGYQDSILPSGIPTGTAEEAIDCACGLYLNDPTAWTRPPTN